MTIRAPLAAALGAGLVCALAAAPAAATVLLPHKVGYRLSLDGSRPTGQLEGMSGDIAYEITGDACSGYTTLTRQESESTTGEGAALSQQIVSKAWEDAKGGSYRFSSTSSSSADGVTEVEANVTRNGGEGITVAVSRPAEKTLELKGDILMPTAHVVKVLAAAAAGENVVAAKVYDGVGDPAKIYDTLAVIGRASTDDSRLAPAAKAVLAGHTHYPVTISYFEPDAKDSAPAYVMAFSLYDNGVVGDLKIDYGRFAVIGAMATFEALKPAETCAPK